MNKHLPTLGEGTVHICVDMQKIFDTDGLWATPWMPRVLPRCVALTEHRPDATIFTRFVTPITADAAHGAWQDFYRRWPQTTRERLDPSMINIVPALARFAPPAPVFDKPVYSAFAGTKLPAFLAERRVDTLVLSGAETDVCVLSTALGAVDHGYRVIVASDAVCSFSDVGHDNLLSLFRERFSQQIVTATVDEIIDRWQA
nr:cysteine hydrolase [Bosea sp. REN20]